MIAAKKTDDRNVYLKLSLSTENSLFQDGFLKSESVLELPRKVDQNDLSKEDVKTDEINEGTSRHPSKNSTVIRIFQAISKGNCDEVDFSLHFVSFKDVYYQNQTVVITSLFCKNYLKRRLMIKLLMRWKMNFQLPDQVYLRDPIHWCCVLNYIVEFKMIIDYLNFDIDYQMRDIDGNTYLHLAVTSNSLPIVKILLLKMSENKIKADQSNLLGFSPYILSRKLGHQEISRHFESTSIISKFVCDNLLYKSPKEWSTLGKVDVEKSRKKSKIGHKSKLSTLRIPEIESESDKKNWNLNSVIHSAYISWENEHVESFRKLAVGKELKIKKTNPIPPIQAMHKKSKIK